MIPCLKEASSNWIKYQYLANAFSKEKDIWVTLLSEPQPYISPRPWNMQCSGGNTTCTITLTNNTTEPDTALHRVSALEYYGFLLTWFAYC